VTHLGLVDGKMRHSQAEVHAADRTLDETNPVGRRSRCGGVTERTQSPDGRDGYWAARENDETNPILKFGYEQVVKRERNEHKPGTSGGTGAKRNA
jgi:hypothetical protein